MELYVQKVFPVSSFWQIPIKSSIRKLVGNRLQNPVSVQSLCHSGDFHRCTHGNALRIKGDDGDTAGIILNVKGAGKPVPPVGGSGGDITPDPQYRTRFCFPGLPDGA